MRKCAPIMIVMAAMGLAVPAFAASGDAEVEAWTPSQDSIRATAAGIALPQTVAGLSLAKSGEVSNGGKAIDNYAQYVSDDGVIQGTFYVYMPTYADASLAAYMTDKAVMERFGGKTRRSAYASVAVAGQAGKAIRAVYDDAADGALTTAAAFVHAGHWIVKMRITGPTERRAEVLAGIDAMLAKLTVDEPATLQSAVPANFAACPAAGAEDATLVAGKGNGTLSELKMPRDGKDALCIRGTVETAAGRLDILQQSGKQDGAIIVPTDDSGTVLAFAPAEPGKDYTLSIHSVGQTDLYGVYDRIPNARQTAAIVDGKDPQTARASSTAAYAANGEITMVGTAGTR